ncbi:MAG: TetR family transcriptional regulator [Chitinophagales bacterium]
MNSGKMTVDKRLQLLEAAEQLFAEKDFDAVSVRELAKVAGVNIAMISYYFGSKEKLFQALIEQKMQVSLAAIQEISERNIPALEKIKNIAEMQVDRIMQNRRFQRIISREMLHNTRPELNNFIVEGINKNRRHIYAIVEQGIKKKELRKVDVEMVLMSVFATITHIVTACNYSRQVFMKNSEDDLFTQQFKQRVKNHLKELLTAMLAVDKKTN